MDAVGFVGLGSIGLPMAQRLVDSRRPTYVWARRPESVAPLRGGAAHLVDDLAELGRQCAVIGLCVRDGASVDDIVHARGLLAAMRPGAILAIHATIDPEQVRRLAAEAPAHGVSVADAPISGGPTLAAAGRLVVMVGAERTVFDRCEPVFAAFARLVTRVGPPGAGQLAKLVNNALFTANLRLADDALVVGQGLGLDRAGLLEVLQASSGGSFAIDSALSRADIVTFGASGAGGLLRKDIGTVHDVLATAHVDGRELLRVAEAGLERLGVPLSCDPHDRSHLTPHGEPHGPRVQP